MSIPLKASFGICLNSCNKALPYSACGTYLSAITLMLTLSMDTLHCNETERRTLVNYPMGWNPTADPPKTLKSNTGFSGLAWASGCGTLVSVELLLIFSGLSDKGAIPTCHKFPSKQSSVTAYSAWQASMHLGTATGDFQLLCLLLLTITLTAGKINVWVSISPSLIWKPKTNIETLKSPNASFPINYQWPHLACWAAEGSNIRPGYFRITSLQPWA